MTELALGFIVGLLVLVWVIVHVRRHEAEPRVSEAWLTERLRGRRE